MSSESLWRPARLSSRQLVDLAADREPALDDIDLDAAWRHGLLGLVATHPQKERLEHGRFLYARQLSRQNVMKAHLGRLLRMLDRASIPAVSLKGPDLALRYRDPRQRTFTDLDLLVPRRHLPDCLELLRTDHAVVGIPPQRPRNDKRDVLLRDQESGMQFAIDLHWDLFSYLQLRKAADQALEEAWGEAKPIVDDLGPRWRLPEAAELAFLACHATLDHRFRLILFRDLLELGRQPVNWLRLIDFASRHGLCSTSYLAWFVVTGALGMEDLEDALDELRPRGLALAAAEFLLPRTDLVTFNGHQPHPLNLAMVLIHDSFPARMALMARAPVAFPGWRQRVSAEGVDRPRPGRSVEVLVTGTQRRGAETFGEQLVAGLGRRGWRAELISLATNPGPRVESTAVTDRPWNEIGRFDFRMVRALRRRLQTSSPDVVLAFGGSTLRYLVAASLGARTRLAYVSIGEPLYWARRGYQRWAYRLLLKGVDLVISVSQRTAHQLSALGVPRHRIHVAPVGAPDEMLDAEAPEVAGPLNILFLGSLSREKDPLCAIDVFERVAARTPARLRLVGSGPLADEVGAEVERRQLSGLVEVTGSVVDVTPQLQWADVLLLTSRTEGLPAAVLEAGAAGVPSVAFDVGGVGEAVRDPDTGILVEYGNIDGMVQAVLAYAVDPQERRRAGREARNLVAARFTIDRAIERYDLLLSSLVREERA